MERLEEVRRRIDEVDARMAALFEERMDAVAEVARCKAESGKPVFDAAREEAVVARNAARITREELKPYYRAFVLRTMEISRAYQRQALGRGVAAYQGVSGAWSQIALRRLFPFASELACATWADVFDAVDTGRAAMGVLPFENSNAGDVSAVLDLLYGHKALYITGLYDLPVRQDLLGLPGARLADIRTVVSHQQALSQSSPFLKSHGLATEVWGNTADAARHVAEQGDKTLAAIASAETARLYGLEILAEGVNEDGDNTTRFIVVSREAPTAWRRLSLLFTVDHKPGKLAQVIQKIGEQGFNMESIKSRPLPHVPFEYYFYVQLVCPAQDRAEEAAARVRLLQSLDEACRTVRLLGLFDFGSDALPGEEL